MTTKQLKMGIILHGAGTGWSDWRHPEALPDASIDWQFNKSQARTAEAGKFDFVFVADQLFMNMLSSPHYMNRPEPLTLLAALAEATTSIGLVGTVSAPYAEPFNVARQFMSLDVISGGRAGWNVVTTFMDGTAANFSRTQHLGHGERYRLAGEHLDVVQGLWDSWEDDALVGDKESGTFVDPDKIHTLDHHGEFFHVRGPLNIGRSPQGAPVIFQAGASEDGKAFASARADVIFTMSGSADKNRALRTEIRGRAEAAGRDPDHVLILEGFRPIVGATEAEAAARNDELAALGSIDHALTELGRALSDFDFGVFDLDGPFPLDAVRDRTDASQTALASILDLAHEGASLRDVALRFAHPSNEFVGTPAQIADALQSWLESGAADGFMFFLSLPGQLDLFVETVVPLLQERGILRSDYAGTTLREHLGLPYATNRYTAAATASDRESSETSREPALDFGRARRVREADRIGTDHAYRCRARH